MSASNQVCFNAQELNHVFQKAYDQADPEVVAHPIIFDTYQVIRSTKDGGWEKYQYEGRGSSYLSKNLYSRWVSVQDQSFKVQITERYPPLGGGLTVKGFPRGFPHVGRTLRLRGSDNRELAKIEPAGSPLQFCFDINQPSGKLLKAGLVAAGVLKAK